MVRDLRYVPPFSLLMYKVFPPARDASIVAVTSASVSALANFVVASALEVLFVVSV